MRGRRGRRGMCGRRGLAPGDGEGGGGVNQDPGRAPQSTAQLLLPRYQEKPHLYPMFEQCWVNVVDGGPTLVKHWVEVWCLRGRYQKNYPHSPMRAQCWASVCNIKPALGEVRHILYCFWGSHVNQEEK